VRCPETSIRITTTKTRRLHSALLNLHNNPIKLLTDCKNFRVRQAPLFFGHLYHFSPQKLHYPVGRDHSSTPFRCSSTTWHRIPRSYRETCRIPSFHKSFKLYALSLLDHQVWYSIMIGNANTCSTYQGILIGCNFFQVD
jgi:hypothetical protein